MRQVEGYGPEVVWKERDFRWDARFIKHFSDASKLPVVMWQIPFGNTVMRAVNNTRYHYQDNKVQRLLASRDQRVLKLYKRSGVVAFLFGAAIGGTTCPTDYSGDGVTNPKPINGNNRRSLSADDDGGFFQATVRRWYHRRPPLILPSLRSGR